MEAERPQSFWTPQLMMEPWEEITSGTLPGLTAIPLEKQEQPCPRPVSLSCAILVPQADIFTGQRTAGLCN